MRLCVHFVIGVGHVEGLDTLQKLHVVQVIHAARIGQHPIDEVALVHVVYHVGAGQVQRVHGVPPSPQLRPAVFAVFQRDNRESRIIVTVQNGLRAQAVRADIDLVPLFVRQHGHVLPAALDVLGVSVQLVQRGTKRLIVCHLPEPHTGHQGTVFLVVKGRKLGQLEHLNPVQVEEPERHAAYQGALACVLDPLVKVSAQSGLCLPLLKGHAVAQQIVCLLPHDKSKET